jgi:hypothetical protein
VPETHLSNALTVERQTMIEQLQKGGGSMDVIRHAGTYDAQAAV